MRIAQVISTPPLAWETGGCARVAFDLSRALARKGHEVTIITTDLFQPGNRYPSSKKSEEVEGIRIRRFPNISDTLAWKRKMYISPDLAAYLRDHVQEFDVVHLQDLISYHAIATNRFCRSRGVPYVLTVHGSLPWLAYPRPIGWVYRSLWGDRILKEARGIIVLNRTEKELCRRLGLKDELIEILPNGVCLSDYDNPPENGTFKRKYNLCDRRIVLYLGRLHQTKGLETLIRAFSDLAPESPRAILALVGPDDDGMVPRLKDLVQNLQLTDRVRFIGYVDHEDKLSVLRDSDMLVTPRFTGFPITFVEACLTGLPIITTTSADDLDWVHGRVGMVVKDDPTELKEAMLTLLTNEDLRIRLGSEGRALATTSFDWDVIADQVLNVYERALARGGG